MGNTLPKAVETVVVERRSNDAFRVGVAEMNGWRMNMEDAHVIFTKASWGFFGVFDGHGGSACSSYIAERLQQELALSPEAPPTDDEAMKELALRLDAEFIGTGQTSGSTGTFAIVTPPAEAGGRHRLRVGNIGDSRVLLGRANGTMVEGQGTDGGLTTDHKPNHPDERARIERTGGHVESGLGGVPRVNGELAVSRAFGDAQFKETGGPGLEERPVTANPEFVTLECDDTDFIMLVCDGISEGDFPNAEVVRLAAEKLREGDGQADPGAAAAAVCRRALERNSRDNLSCMIVLLSGGEVPGPQTELQPGPVDSLSNENFRTAYAAMAEKAGLSLAEAAELRYGVLRRRIDEAGSSADVSSVRELEKFEGGPPESEEGSARSAWFEHWVKALKKDGGGADGGDDESLPLPPSLLRMLGASSAGAA